MEGFVLSSKTWIMRECFLCEAFLNTKRRNVDMSGNLKYDWIHWNFTPFFSLLQESYRGWFLVRKHLRSYRLMIRHVDSQNKSKCFDMFDLFPVLLCSCDELKWHRVQPRTFILKLLLGNLHSADPIMSEWIFVSWSLFSMNFVGWGTLSRRAYFIIGRSEISFSQWTPVPLLQLCMCCTTLLVRWNVFCAAAYHSAEWTSETLCSFFFAKSDAGNGSR